MSSRLLDHAKQWIASSWRDIGAGFGANPVPVIQFERLEVDDLAFPFKNDGKAWWLLDAGMFCDADWLSIERVPYVAFALVEEKQRMDIQAQWAPRCGYGFQIEFDATGKVVAQRMLWIS